jgi:hypothetical protein
MTEDHNGLKYNLHEFLGDVSEIEKLKKLYFEFFNRSQPLDFKSRTLSDQISKKEKHFKFLISETKIFFASCGEEVAFFIAFDPQLQSMDWTHCVFDPKECCEFVFAASRNFNQKAFATMAKKIFFLIKEYYNVKYIVGNVRRKNKKKQFMRLSAKVFDFQFVEDFAYYEIPQQV